MHFARHERHEPLAVRAGLRELGVDIAELDRFV